MHAKLEASPLHSYLATNPTIAMHWSSRLYRGFDWLQGLRLLPALDTNELLR